MSAAEQQLCYVRMLCEGDEMDCVALARDQHAASRYAHLLFEGERVYKLAQACMTLPNYGCAVLSNGDRVVGYAAMVIEPYMWSDITIARDLAVYIDPEHRSWPAFKKLIARIEQWCKSKGVHTLDFGITSPPDDATAKRYGVVYKALGYVWHGEHYRKEFG
jgi:GNAT superfamily N-acetyltransferase